MEQEKHLQQADATRVLTAVVAGLPEPHSERTVVAVVLRF